MSLSKANLLSIDYGTKKSGLAYSVDGFCFALGTVPTHTLVPKIQEAAAKRGVTALVIGMPYNIDGSLSHHGKRVQTFAK